jgi:hypothetical protein
MLIQESYKDVPTKAAGEGSMRMPLMNSPECEEHRLSEE